MMKVAIVLALCTNKLLVCKADIFMLTTSGIVLIMLVMTWLPALSVTVHFAGVSSDIKKLATNVLSSSAARYSGVLPL